MEYGDAASSMIELFEILDLYIWIMRNKEPFTLNPDDGKIKGLEKVRKFFRIPKEEDKHFKANPWSDGSYSVSSKNEWYLL